MRMTRKEMQKKYPNQWIGLADVEKTQKDGLISAEVVYTDKTASELGMMSLRGEGIEPFFTTPDNTFFLGALGIGADDLEQTIQGFVDNNKCN